MINVTERISVPHPPEIVWSVLSDPAEVVACLDGSELGDSHEDGSFDARIAVKFAAIRVSFAARAKLELNHEEQKGHLEAKGGDARGSTRVSGHMDYTVEPDTNGSLVNVDGAADIKGPLASLVTTGAAVVVNRMVQSFAAQLTKRCAELDPGHTPETASQGASGRWFGQRRPKGEG